MKLFAPIKIGPLELKNRIVMPAMGTGYGNEMGYATDRLRAYIQERARGGAALIIVECTCVDSQGGRRFWRHLCVDSDRYIPALYELAETIHQYGAKAALQLHHAGRLADPAVNGGIQPVSASPVPGHSGISRREIMARELGVMEIKELVEKFAAGVRRAKQAGFDAVEFHGAHGFLIAQFLSPYSNHRTDEYGGDLQGRMRFALEIIRRSKEEGGQDFPLIFRISADEYLPGGLTLAESREICRELVKAGVDALHVSAGDGDESPWIKSGIMPEASPPGCLIPFAGEIKKAVQVPVIAVGRINDPRLAEKILQEGKADLVAMARALLADPHLPRKALKGRHEEIRKCIACTRCPTFVLRGGGVRCTVNAALGRENEERLVPLTKRKKVLIAGGGPAGLEAARCAALRGHSVLLFEKEKLLGGQVRLASRAPYKGEMMNIVHYLAHQLTKLGVEVVLGEEVSIPVIQNVSPEVLILATGALPSVSAMKGARPGKQASTWEVLAGGKFAGSSMLVLGGQAASLQAAEVLANQGKQVVLLSEEEEIGGNMESRSLFLLLERLESKKVRIIKNARLPEWRDPETLSFLNREGAQEMLDVEMLVLPVRPLPNQRLAQELRSIGYERKADLFLIGDGLAPRSLFSAIHDGYTVGKEI